MTGVPVIQVTQPMNGGIRRKVNSRTVQEPVGWANKKRTLV